MSNRAVLLGMMGLTVAAVVSGWRWWLRRRLQQHHNQVAGLGRARKHRLVVPATAELPSLALDVWLSPAPAVDRPTAGPPLIVYCLDPEPVLFPAASLFAYAQAHYFASSPPTDKEASFRTMVVVGVGHCAESFGLTAAGFDSRRLRDLRRLDFPPFDHPTVRPGRRPNKHAQRFVEALADNVVPWVERDLLGSAAFGPDPPRRCFLGASYSAVLGLQAMLARPGVWQDFVLGSPSVCFDPEVLDQVDAASSWHPHGTGAVVLLGAREAQAEPPLSGNVHGGMVPMARELAKRLRTRGVHVDGPNLIDDEDHTSVKLALVSRGLAWLALRAAASTQPRGG